MFEGKCSKCNEIKTDFIIKPTNYDILLCNDCYKEICKNNVTKN